MTMLTLTLKHGPWQIYALSECLLVSNLLFLSFSCMFRIIYRMHANCLLKSYWMILQLCKLLNDITGSMFSTTYITDTHITLMPQACCLSVSLSLSVLLVDCDHTVQTRSRNWLVSWLSPCRSWSRSWHPVIPNSADKNHSGIWKVHSLWWNFYLHCDRRPRPVCAMPAHLFAFCEWYHIFCDFGNISHFWRAFLSYMALRLNISSV